MRRSAVLLLCAGLTVSACTRTTYHGFEAKDPPLPLVERRVQFYLSPAYFRDPPRCAAIHTLSPAPASPVTGAIERAVERHMSTRLPRVMGTGQVDRTTVHLAVELSNPADRRVFRRQTGCDALVRIRIHGVTDDYFVIWSQRAVALTLELIRTIDGKLLWKAHHRAERGDGGLPLSILSLPFTFARAARLKGDQEAFESIADDAVRRMMATLPDLRPRAQNGALSD